MVIGNLGVRRSNYTDTIPFIDGTLGLNRVASGCKADQRRYHPCTWL